MNDQAEIPDVPPVGRLKKLRSILPTATRIIGFAKAVEHDLERTDGFVAKADSRAVSIMRRACQKQLDAVGLPVRRVRNSLDFPEGTRQAAAASKQFWEALEVAGSAVVGVSAAEHAAIPRNG